MDGRRNFADIETYLEVVGVRNFDDMNWCDSNRSSGPLYGIDYRLGAHR